MTEGLRSPAGRAVALDMLGFVVRRQPTWLHKVLVVVEWMGVVVVEWIVVVVEWTVVTLCTRWCSTRCSTSW